MMVLIRMKLIEEIISKINETNLGIVPTKRLQKFLTSFKEGERYNILMGFHFKKGKEALGNTRPDYSSGIDKFITSDRRKTEYVIKELFVNNDLRYNLENYTSVILSALKFAYERSHRSLTSFTFNIYYEPGFILGWRLLDVPKEFKIQLNKDILLLLEDIQTFYTFCYKQLEESLRKLLPSSIWLDNKLEPFYYDSINIFVALMITYWNLIQKPENKEEYILLLNEFLTDFLIVKKKQDFNVYLKSKFKQIILNEIEGSSIKFVDVRERQKEETEVVKKTSIILEDKAEISESKGKIYLTGSVKGRNKASIRLLLEKKGFIWGASVWSKVDLVVTGNNPGKKALEDAERLNLPVISWEEFSKKHDVESPKEEYFVAENRGKVYVTGKIERKNKAEVQQIVKQMGFTWSPSINNRLTHLVYGKNPGQKKIDLAERYGIDLIKWEDFIEKYKVEIKTKRIIVLDDRTGEDTSSPLGKEDIIELTQNKKWEVRYEAYKELINFNEDVLEILSKALADKSEKIRMMALEELRTHVSEEEMFEILTKALADKSREIRIIALEELKKRDPEKVPYLLYELTKHDDKRVGVNTFWIYNREQYKDKVKHLVELLDLESNVSVQQMAFAELVRISPPNLDEILVKGLYIQQLSAVRKSLELLIEREHPKLAELLLDGIFTTFFGYKFFPYLESIGFHKEILEKAIDIYDSADKTVKGRIKAKFPDIERRISKN